MNLPRQEERKKVLIIAMSNRNFVPDMTGVLEQSRSLLATYHDWEPFQDRTANLDFPKTATILPPVER
jgi:hypothetical protein